MEVWQTPPPTSDRNVAQRRYKKAVGVVKHNEPVDQTHINIIFSRSYAGRKLGPILHQAERNGHLRQLNDGRYVTTDSVE